MKYELYYWDSLYLKTKSLTVTEFDGRLKNISELAIDAMIELNGVGLAANQIGFKESLFVYRDEDTDSIETLVNAEIKEIGFPKYKMHEGCLSIPEYYFEVARYTNVTIEAQKLDGKVITIKAEGFKSQIFQHEIDHLNGIRVIDRLSPSEKKRVIRKIKK